jgi:hypothetical protein
MAIQFLNNVNADSGVLYVDAVNDRVGIGTTSPDAPLHIKSTNFEMLKLEQNDANGGLIRFLNTDDTDGWFTGIAGTEKFIISRTADNTSPIITVEQNGDVGIGTDSPSQKLEVNGAVLAGDYRGSANIYLTSPDSWIFRSTGGNERMRITSAGNVGIGTTSPGKELDVVGTIRATDGSSQHQLRPTQLISYGTAAIINAESAGYDVRLNTQSSTVLIAKADGKVGIGTTIPSTKLHLADSNDVYLTLDSTNTSTAEEVAIKYSNFSTGINYWWEGLNQSANYSLAYGTTYSGANVKMEISTAGEATFAGKIIAEKGVQFTGGTIAAATTVLHTNNVVYARGGSSGMFLQNADGSDGIFIANDHVRVETGTAERMRITSTGNVGIGTSSPEKRLHVSSSDQSTARIRISNTNTGSGGDNIDLVAGVHNVTQDGFSIYNATSNQTELVIRGGNVGIGTTNPVQKLHVNNSTASSASYAKFSNAQTGTTTADGFDVGVNTGTEAIIWQRENSNLLFATNNTERIRITSGGNVGIGTTNPGSKLEVNGEIDANGGDGYRIETKPFATWSSDLLTLGDWDGEGYATRIMGSNSSEVMRVTGTNVGIGTTAPGAKLEVNGNSRFIGSMQFYQGSTSNQYLNILQSGGSTFINTGTSGETIYFGAPSSNTTNLYIQGTATINSIANATTDTDKFLVSQSGTVQYRTGAQLASDIGAVTGGPFLPISGGTLTGGLSIPEYLYHSGDQNTNLRFQNDSIELYTGGWKVFGNTTLKYGALYGDNALRVYATQAGGYVNGSLEVSDYVKAVDGYKGYVSYFHNAGFFHSPRSQDGANPLFIPINTTGMSSSDQYYNTWVPLYAGRVRKIIIKHISGSTPVATACTFRKKINGTLSGTTYAGTVTGGGSAGMKVTFDFGTTNFTFNAEDEVQIGIVTGVATQPRMGGCSCQIWYEYNIT